MSGPCEDRLLLLQADHDGELDAGRAAELAAHVAGCTGCAAARQELAEVSGRLRAELVSHRAPDRLRAAIAAASAPPAATTVVPLAARRSLMRRQVPGFLAGLAAAASVAFVLVPPRGADTAEEVLGGHLRSLQAQHLVDVVSSDRHQVKPWFDGRLDFAPPVRDLAAEGFPLEGGRLDHIGGRAVAALVYRRQRHVINLFLWPTQSLRSSEPAASTRAGYNMLRWTDGEMTAWAVSDVNLAELEDFMRLWRAAP